jgi:hypothetical protein
MMAAITAARSGRRVLLIEKQKQGGRKLLASGGGRCNISRAMEAGEMISHFGAASSFVKPAIRAFAPDAFRDFLHSIGVSTHCEPDGGIYPSSQRSKDVFHSLLSRIHRADIHTLPEQPALGLMLDGEGAICGLRTPQSTIRCRRLILATGGSASSALGGSSDGYRLAQQAGHSIHRPVPALTGIRTLERWTAACAGISLPRARLRVDGGGSSSPQRSQGALLFTHQGISGPAALDICGAVARRIMSGQKVTLVCTPVSSMDREAWSGRFQQWRHHSGGRPVRNLLAEHLPRAFAEQLCMMAAVPEGGLMGELGRKAQKSLLRLLTELPLRVERTGSLERAMVTAGGVAGGEIDPSSMRSRLCTGLFFAGELIDVDGPCGGYNLHWAFASGRLAGERAGGQAR